MALFQWRQSWEPFRDLERLLEGIRLPIPNLAVGRPYPPVNLYELEDEYLLIAPLPGTVPEQLELTVKGGILTLKGERLGPAGVPDERFRRHERLWGVWQRSFSLPDRVAEDRVAAEFSDGVLKIHLPRTKEVRSRQIRVASNSDVRPLGQPASEPTVERLSPPEAS